MKICQSEIFELFCQIHDTSSQNCGPRMSTLRFEDLSDEVLMKVFSNLEMPGMSHLIRISFRIFNWLVPDFSSKI